LALIKFLDGFDADMSYQLGEINLSTLEDMQKSAVSVETNLLARRDMQRTKRRVTIKQEPSTSSSDDKLYSIVKTMERMMERLTIADMNTPREISLLLRLEIQISEGTLPRPNKESPEIKRNKGVLIRRLDHHCKKTMLMKERI
jgi:hypothetical protein